MEEIVMKYPTSDSVYLLPIIKKQGDVRRQYDNALHLVSYRLKELSTMLKLQRPLTMYVARIPGQVLPRRRKLHFQSSAKVWDMIPSQRHKSTLPHWKRRLLIRQTR